MQTRRKRRHVRLNSLDYDYAEEMQIALLYYTKQKVSSDQHLQGYKQTLSSEHLIRSYPDDLDITLSYC